MSLGGAQSGVFPPKTKILELNEVKKLKHFLNKTSHMIQTLFHI